MILFWWSDDDSCGIMTCELWSEGVSSFYDTSKVDRWERNLGL